jgi:transglutaminase superfamily protein
VAVALAAPLLARLDLPRLYRCLEPSPRSPRLAPPDPGRVIAVFGRRMDRVIRWGKPLVRAGCLTRGITGYYILRRSGLDVALCFGVDPKHGPGVLGHCWLVFGGEPVLEAANPLAAYTEMVRMSSRGLTTASPAP